MAPFPPSTCSSKVSSFLAPPPPTLTLSSSAPSSDHNTLTSSHSQRQYTTPPAHRSISAYFSDYSLECGVASPYTTEPVRVLPGLFLGAEHNATNLTVLSKLGIGFVLNVAVEIARDGNAIGSSCGGGGGGGGGGMGGHDIKDDNKNKKSTSNLSNGVHRNGVEYRSLSWSHSQHNVLHDFPAAFEFIDGAMAKGGKVLVHCQLGVSRSASLVIAYVMRAQKMGLSEAYDYVKQLSAVISPNMSLMYQLAEFEKSVKGHGQVMNDTKMGYAAEEEEEDDDDDDDVKDRYRGYVVPETDLDDEPPYPFLDMEMDTATVPSLPTMIPPPPATPMRTEFFSQRQSGEARTMAVTVSLPSPSRPRHARTLSNSSKRNSIIHSPPHNDDRNNNNNNNNNNNGSNQNLNCNNNISSMAASSPNVLSLPAARSRPTPYRRSPLTTLTNLHSPKTPTTEKFSRLSLGLNLGLGLSGQDDGEVDENKSSYSIKRNKKNHLNNNNNNNDNNNDNDDDDNDDNDMNTNIKTKKNNEKGSETSSGDDVEMKMAMVEPPSPIMTAPSTPQLYLPSTRTSSSASSFVVFPTTSRPVSTSSVCSFLAPSTAQSTASSSSSSAIATTMTTTILQPPAFGEGSCSSSSESEYTEDEEAEQDDEAPVGQGLFSPRNSWTIGTRPAVGVSLNTTQVHGPQGLWQGVSGTMTAGQEDAMEKKKEEKEETRGYEGGGGGDDGSGSEMGLGAALAAKLTKTLRSKNKSSKKTKTTPPTTTPTTPTTTTTTTTTYMTTSIVSKSSRSSKTKSVVMPEFIFSPRPYMPFRRHETRSFGEFYQTLCMGRMSE
ncbi:hypothetical protein BGZ94_001618 [Podila epigama]|nr:hypothetical protein BGZ94_001618 [Podila epigama]